MDEAKQLSFYMAIAIALSTVIGSGIWRDPLKWSNNAGLFAILGLIVAWLLFFTAGLSYAECVGMFPKSGGPYSYVTGAFNKRFGATLGLLYFIGYLLVTLVLGFLTALFTLAAIDLDMVTNTNLLVLTVVYLLILGILASVLSLRSSGEILLAWAILKIALLLAVASMALVNMNTANYSLPSITVNEFQLSVALPIWALLGFEVILVFSEEVKREKKGDKLVSPLPKTLIITLFIILAVYLVVLFGAIGIVGYHGLEEKGTIGIMLVYANKVGLSSNIFFAFAMLSAMGTTYALLLLVLHQFKVLARDDAFPFVSSENATKKESFYSIILVIISAILGAIMVYLVNTGIYESAIDLVAGVGVGLILISAMLPAGYIALYLRVKLPALTRPFKAPLYITTFPTAIILSLYLIYANYMSVPGIELIAILSSLIIGILVYVVVLVKIKS